MESVITTRGRFTIPKAVLKHLRLRPGDRMKFFVHPDGSVALLPKLPVTAVKGTVKPRRRATIEETSEAIAATERVTRSRRR